MHGRIKCVINVCCRHNGCLNMCQVAADEPPKFDVGFRYQWWAAFLLMGKPAEFYFELEVDQRL